MEFVRILITVLAAVLAACAGGPGPEDGPPAASSNASEGSALDANSSFDAWLEVVDEELARIDGAAWTDAATVDTATMCGPVDEVLGWRLTATAPLEGSGADLAPPDDAWELVSERGASEVDDPTRWRHRQYSQMTLESTADGVQVRVELPGAPERWGADHPRAPEAWFCG